MSHTQKVDDVVSQLVQSHFEIEPAINEIVWLKDGTEIRLIEVNSDTLPTGTIEVFLFAPTEEVPFPVRIADITPQEWEKVRRDEIPLPSGWSLEDSQVFSRQEA